MKEKIKLGYIGMGRRGRSMLNGCYSKMDDVDIVAICDLREERLEGTREIFEERQKPMPKMTTNYMDIINDPEIDAVVVMTPWAGRVDIAIDAMRANKQVAIEVGCAQSLDECYRLLEAYKETGIHVMMLENCCYDQREMAIYNMVKQGLFGEIVHCDGAYRHFLPNVDLLKEIMDGKEFTHYRLKHYIEQNRENYPTHELGPICKVLDINRGNRLVSLSSFASKARGIKQFAADQFGEDSEWAKIDYKQGDIVTTIITCADGATISLTLDTTLPRGHYSRGYSIRGTKGCSIEDSNSIYLKEMGEKVRDNEKEMIEKYEHPLWKNFKESVKATHGNMDWFISRAFVESVKKGVKPPIDIYDTLTWLAIGPLSAQSIAQGGAPVEVPDFTEGAWQNREPIVKGKYCLEEVCDEK